MELNKIAPNFLVARFGSFAKSIFALMVVICFSQAAQAQTKDLSIFMVNYDENELTTNDTLKFEFTISNNGSVTYPMGSTLYGNLELNGIVLSFDLLGFAPSPIVLPQALAPGDSLTFNYGYLLASQTIPFIPGATDSLGICLILWGDDLANIANFSGDLNPADNKTCFNYQIPEPDLSVDMVYYAEGEVTTADTIKLVFEVVNLGNVTYAVGDTLYFNARLNGILFSMDLLGNAPTPVALPIELAPGDTIVFDPGYLLGPPMLPFFPGANSIEMCVIAWGNDFGHLANYSGDVDTVNNTTCVTYASPMPDLSIDMVHYTEAEISSNDTLKFEFTIKNLGNVAYPEGAILYGNVVFNGFVFALDLLGSAPSPILLPNGLAPGESATFNYGILLASQTIPFIPGATDSLGVCLVLWGEDLANIANYSGDINTADNTTCFSYKKTTSAVNDLSGTSEPALSIYPNPADTYTTIEMHEKASIVSIEVEDINGKTLKAIQSHTNKHQMDVSNLTNGIYFVKTRLDNQKVIVERLIINH